MGGGGLALTGQRLIDLSTDMPPTGVVQILAVTHGVHFKVNTKAVYRVRP